MKNLKRFRSWIAFLAAACRSYLRQLSTRKTADDHAAAEGAGSENRTERPAKAVTAPTVGPKPAASSNRSAPESKPVAVPVKTPVVQVTAEVAVANGKAHQSAQRLARVLISEIKLYYMSKMEGQDESKMRNIYDLLKDPIDKSRQHYDQRVGADASSMPDYFHGELVRTLCAGDESRLGPNYTAK